MLSGITHAHSTYSFDGSLALPDLQRFLTDSGIDFCLMSEHVESLDYQTIQRMLTDYAALPTTGCLMIPGIEIDDLHILIYGVTAIRPYVGVEDLAAQMFHNGALIFVSHPVKVKRTVPAVILPWLTGVEIWNTRYDGRGAPRPWNLKLWAELQRERGPLQPLVGVDFHKTSDLSPVRVELDCDKDPGAILKSIAAGTHSLSSNGKKFDPQRLVGAPSFATFIFDFAVAINRKLNKLPFRIPRSLKRVVKKCL
ncbi:MAG: hypothetical protein ABSD72_00780 [Terracidiphilus sp.]|jgi:hypothetical protein